MSDTPDSRRPSDEEPVDPADAETPPSPSERPTPSPPDAGGTAPPAADPGAVRLPESTWTGPRPHQYWAGQAPPGQQPYPAQQSPGQQGPSSYHIQPMSPVGDSGYWRSSVKPGVIPLRPLGLGEILDGAISTMRAHPALMLGVAAVVVTIANLITLAVTFPWLDDVNRAVAVGPQLDQDEVFSLLGKSLAITVIGLVVLLVSRVFLSGFITLVVGTAVLGQPLTFADVWTRVRPRLLPLLGLTLIYPAVVFGVAVIVIFVTVTVPPLGVLLVLGIIPVAIWLLIMFSLATPALVLENARIGQAFGRSRQLVRGAWWRIFGITLLAGLITTILAVIIALPFEYLGDGFATVTSTEATPLTTKYLVLSTIGTIIASTVTEPFAAAVTVLLYTDQRMRTEGLDIELARAAGMR